MIRPEGFRGAAFGAAAAGDGRRDSAARAELSEWLGISAEWAFVRQVHGSKVVQADVPGLHGEADALVTTVPILPLTVAVADCVPIVLEGDGAVGIVHAGWRGAAAGVATAAVVAMAGLGAPPLRAAIGPGIGPCCFEVGPEVSERFPGHTRSTGWGTMSVDLVGALQAQLGEIPTWVSEECTYCGTGHRSFRRDGTKERQVAVAWISSD